MSRLIYRHVDVKLPHPDGPIRVKGKRVDRWKYYEVHPGADSKHVKVTDLQEIHEVMEQFHADRKRAS